MIDTLVKRGGFVKDLHGAKNVYYQVNATYYSALGEDDRRMLLDYQRDRLAHGLTGAMGRERERFARLAAALDA